MTTRQDVIASAQDYFLKNIAGKKIRPGLDYIPASGKVVDQDDLAHLIDSSLDLWLTSGRFAATFEKEFAAMMNHNFCLLTNSGSSANLLAFTALTSPLLAERQIKQGDEVITVAAGFPTTVNPIIQNGCIPVFVDIKIPEYQIDVAEIKKALGPKTRAIMIAHTLGQMFDIDAVKEVACGITHYWPSHTLLKCIALA